MRISTRTGLQTRQRILPINDTSYGRTDFSPIVAFRNNGREVLIAGRMNNEHRLLAWDTRSGEIEILLRLRAEVDRGAWLAVANRLDDPDIIVTASDFSEAYALDETKIRVYDMEDYEPTPVASFALSNRISRQNNPRVLTGASPVVFPSGQRIGMPAAGLACLIEVDLQTGSRTALDDEITPGERVWTLGGGMALDPSGRLLAASGLRPQSAVAIWST